MERLKQQKQKKQSEYLKMKKIQSKFSCEGEHLTVIIILL
jgi:hypothetical protein